MSLSEYFENNNPVIKRALKPVRDEVYNSRYSRYWYINNDMRRRMRNGDYYEYKELLAGSSHSAYYTHISNDGFIYHESWFDDPFILKLDDEDFLI